MNEKIEIVGHFVGEFSDIGTATAQDPAAEFLRPSRTFVFDDQAVEYPNENRNFVVYFRAETKLPPMAVQGAGVELVGPAYGIWVRDAGEKKYVSMLRFDDVVGILPGKPVSLDTAT